MPAIEEQIERIGRKLQLLVKQYGELQAENRQLRQQLADAEQRHNQAAETAEGLQAQLLTFRAALGQLADEEKKAFEKRINGFIRDIDKTIALLGE
jgi:chromosome segregation ATPase